MTTYVNLTTGDPAPWFHQRSFANPRYAFDTAAGRYIVLCFFGSASGEHAQAALRTVRGQSLFFDDKRACFFGVSNDPRDEQDKRVADSYPGYRYLWDFDGLIGRLYGVLPRETTPGAVAARLRWVILDPTLRVIKVVPFAPDRSDIVVVLNTLRDLPPPSQFAGIELQAPILFLPNVFEPAFCRRLVDLYETNGGQESGFMREVNGQTVSVHDAHHKRRRDYVIESEDVIKATQARIIRRINPEIAKVYNFNATRMERYIVCCYAAEDQAHFRAHRDNTTKGTAHRRFAVSINLNDDFDGGEVSFPEYGPRSFKAPIGGAVIFPCALLHAVSKVTRGRRFAFLPFIYDDEAARLRERNVRYLEEGNSTYRSGLEDTDSAVAAGA